MVANKVVNNPLFRYTADMSVVRCVGRVGKQAAQLLDYSRYCEKARERRAVSRYQTEFVGFGIKVIPFASPPSVISLSS